MMKIMSLGQNITELFGGLWPEGLASKKTRASRRWLFARLLINEDRHLHCCKQEPSQSKFNINQSNQNYVRVHWSCAQPIRVGKTHLSSVKCFPLHQEFSHFLCIHITFKMTQNYPPCTKCKTKVKGQNSVVIWLIVCYICIVQVSKSQSHASFNQYHPRDRPVDRNQCNDLRWPTVYNIAYPYRPFYGNGDIPIFHLQIAVVKLQFELEVFYRP